MTIQAAASNELVFDIEVDSFCYGLRAFPGKLSKELVYRVIRELKPALRTAFEQLENFDLINSACRLSDASGFVLNEKEIIFFMSLLFPLPEQLDEESQCCMAQVLDTADQKYSSLLSELEKVWKEEREKQLALAIKTFSSTATTSNESSQLRL